MVLEILKPTNLLFLIFSNMIQGINLVLKGIVKNPLLLFIILCVFCISIKRKP